MNSEPPLLAIYDRLLARYGEQHWWPAESPFEVIVGAILTQSAAWTNVEKGVANLKRSGVLSPQALCDLGLAEIASLIHSCGYYNAKARKLKAFAEWLRDVHGGDLNNMFACSTSELREQLLKVYGIGEETADSILLYAGNKQTFVIDAYTRRIADRLGLRVRGGRYSDYQRYFMRRLPRDSRVYNEFHALLVRLGKEVCRKSKGLCLHCCLKDLCKSVPEDTFPF